MDITFKKLLFIGPHPDDVELGCGGILSKYSEGSQITYLILSPCLEDPKNKNILNEAKNAASRLGLSADALIIKDLPRRTFHDQRREIRDFLISARDKYRPEAVFCPSLKDVHQDHSVTAEETLRLFRDVSVISYEAPRSAIFFQPVMYIELKDKHVKDKITALMCYKSQFDKYYFQPGVIESFALMRGSQCSVKYAEAFEVLRLKA
jgi:LmbE family N-acetylglucosaminyl deacetylase